MVMKRFLLLLALFASSSSTHVFAMHWIEYLNNYQGYKCSGVINNKSASVSTFRLQEVFKEVEFRCKELTFNYKRDDLCNLTANKFKFKMMIKSLNLSEELEKALIELRDSIFTEDRYAFSRELLKLNADFYAQAAEIACYLGKTP
jgi:hypothetical protein